MLCQHPSTQNNKRRLHKYQGDHTSHNRNACKAFFPRFRRTSEHLVLSESGPKSPTSVQRGAQRLGVSETKQNVQTQTQANAIFSQQIAVQSGPRPLRSGKVTHVQAKRTQTSTNARATWNPTDITQKNVACTSRTCEFTATCCASEISSRGPTPSSKSS